MEPVADRTFAQTLRSFSAPVLAALALTGCATAPPLAATRNQIIISVRDQKLTLVREDHTRITYPISTSKFGLGDRSRSYATPTGELAVAEKIGAGKPTGTVFHGRVSTGEIVKIDAPGRDAIVTRILALRGLEQGNKGAFSRGIYIHGTPEERNIGRPTSYGCIRMRSRDVIQLFDAVRVGARVQIIDSTQNQAIASNILTPPPNAPASANPTAALESAEAAANKPAASPVNPAATTATVPGPAKASDSVPAAAAPPAGKKEWAGSPTQMLAKQAAHDARAKKNAKPPVGAPAGTRPVSNNSDDSARTMKPLGVRFALSSLPHAATMQNRRWVRPVLAFAITFGLLAMVGAVVRVVAVYQRLFSLGMKPDDPGVAEAATRELSRMDGLYTLTFLGVIFLVSGVSAAIFAWWRPKVKTDLPPPLPNGR